MFLSIFNQPDFSNLSIVKTNQPYDVIGDIHGHADELHALLAKLGYENRKGTHTHPEGRKVVFLGDYIDRGPQIREVLQTVRGMVDSGNAHAILGNHEVNALWFHTIGPKGRPLRTHTDNRIKQHQATRDQMGAGFRQWMPCW
jgi:predicted MPP superfamily phosphohydrolase